MKLQVSREQLLTPLQQVIGVVERRQTMPVLSNVLLVADGAHLTLTATDLEVELVSTTGLVIDQPGAVTLPARKLLDILRSLPEDGTVTLSTEGDMALLRCGRSRFNLATLPADQFPALEEADLAGAVHLPQATLKHLLERTQFAMAQQDVRYYLNGLLLEIGDGVLRAVATDGHRLAYSEIPARTDVAPGQQVIVPRKGIQELARLLADDDEEVTVRLSNNHLQVRIGDIRYTSKLIDGKFPDYQRVIPHNNERVVIADRLGLRSALSRTAILANEKYRGIRLQLEPWRLGLQAHNPEQEVAEEEVEVNYDGESIEIGFNVTYLLDALGALGCETVKLSFRDSNSSCLVEDPDSSSTQYVVMPMRL